MPDPDFDPEYFNRIRWIRISIPFEWIAKAWRKIFGPKASGPVGPTARKEEKNEKD